MIGWLRTSAVLLVVGLVTPPLALLQYLAVKTGVLDDVIPSLWHRFMVKMLGLRLHVHGRMADRRPLLLAGNHISWIDIMVIGAAAKVNFIAKSEVSGWPGIGILAYLQRSVFVERERRGRSGAQASEIAERLKRGDVMFLFAEGSTGDGNMLLPFKTTLFGAASMAVDQGVAQSVAIQPVAIAYTRLHGMPMSRRHRMGVSWIGDSPMLPYLAALVREGGVDVEVHFGEPVDYGPGANRKAVAQEVERRVQDMFTRALRAPRPSRG